MRPAELESATFGLGNRRHTPVKHKICIIYKKNALHRTTKRYHCDITWRHYGDMKSCGIIYIYGKDADNGHGCPCLFGKGYRCGNV